MTFNQVKVEPGPPVASVGTGRFPPSVGDTIAGNTERYYSPPQYTSPPAISERLLSFEPLKPASSSWMNSFFRFMKGAYRFLLVAGLIVTTAMAVFFAQEANHERERNYERQNRARERYDRENANGRAQYAWDQIEEALILSQEAAEKAAEAGATLKTGDEKPIDLDKYAYENAEMEAKVTKQGSETLSLTTRQNFDAVQEFYEKKFGKPVLQVVVGHQENQRKKILFQASTQPPILIKVEQLDRGPVKITILHSFLWFPRANEAQARL
jgi:hypothetical protein